MDADPDDLALALELADIADSITFERFGAEDLQVASKPDMTPVSEADTAVEQAIRDRLASSRPSDAVIGEELGASDEATAQRRWIVDPIDGTKSFVRGAPGWATLLALDVGARTSVGVVSAPALGRRWWASRGGGAFAGGAGLDPRRIHVSAVAELADAEACVGIAEWVALDRADAAVELVRRCWHVHGYRDFWSYMLVAEGAVEIGLDPVASVWDLAAPRVIVEEAGGRFTDLSGQDTIEAGDALATNGLVHDAVLSIVGR